MKGEISLACSKETVVDLMQRCIPALRPGIRHNLIGVGLCFTLKWSEISLFEPLVICIKTRMLSVVFSGLYLTQVVTKDTLLAVKPLHVPQVTVTRLSKIYLWVGGHRRRPTNFYFRLCFQTLSTTREGPRDLSATL